jgi:hypothetical protein
MSYPYGQLAILRQQELLREAAQRRREHPRSELDEPRKHDRKQAVRRLLHR